VSVREQPDQEWLVFPQLSDPDPSDLRWFLCADYQQVQVLLSYRNDLRDFPKERLSEPGRQRPLVLMDNIDLATDRAIIATG
jgi:hypothetical protein